MKIKMRFCLPLLLALSPWLMAYAQAPSADPTVTAESPEWYIDKNMSDMTPANRFMDAVMIYNPARAPLYVRATVRRLALDSEGARQVTPDSSGVLRVFPEEFVVPAGGVFQARLLADASRLAGTAASFYIKFEDVSSLYASADDSSSAVMSGFQLAYEVMVAVNRSPKAGLKDGDLALHRDSAGGVFAENRTGQHIYLNRGYVCDKAGQQLSECREWAGIPRQSILPGEKVLVSGGVPSAGAVAGLLAYPMLNSRGVPSRLYVPMP